MAACGPAFCADGDYLMCFMCQWYFFGRDAVREPDSITLCPKCRQPAHRVTVAGAPDSITSFDRAFLDASRHVLAQREAVLARLAQGGT